MLDLAVVDQITDGVSILEGNGQGGSWRCPRSRSETTRSIYHSAIVAGDFTGNGILDLAVASASFDAPDNVSILLGEGNGTFDPQPSIPLGTFACALVDHHRKLFRRRPARPGGRRFQRQLGFLAPR